MPSVEAPSTAHRARPGETLLLRVECVSDSGHDWLQGGMSAAALYAVTVAAAHFTEDEKASVACGTCILRSFCGVVPCETGVVPVVETYARPMSELNALHTELVQRAPDGYSVGEVCCTVQEWGYESAWFFAFYPGDPASVVWFENPETANVQKDVPFFRVMFGNNVEFTDAEQTL